MRIQPGSSFSGGGNGSWEDDDDCGMNCGDIMPLLGFVPLTSR